MAEGDRPGHPAARAGQVAPPATSTRRVASSHGAGDVGEFVRDLDFSDLPADVVAQAERCLLDLIGVAAAGSRTARVRDRESLRGHADVRRRSRCADPL
jgi:hypothetical protein